MSIGEGNWLSPGAVHVRLVCVEEDACVCGGGYKSNSNWLSRGAVPGPTSPEGTYVEVGDLLVVPSGATPRGPLPQTPHPYRLLLVDIVGGGGGKAEWMGTSFA
jgi:hypothetical protein